MERVKEPRPEHLVTMRAMMVHSIPSVLASSVEAVVAIPGGNSPLKIGDAIRLYNSNPIPNYFLVPGIHPAI